MPGWSAVPLAIVLLASPAAAAERCAERVISGSVSGVEDGDLRLRSGEAIRLVDVRLLEAVPGRPDGIAWLSSLAGREATAVVAGPADRWGRLPGRVQLLPDRIDLSELLVAEGLAAVDVGEEDALCRPELLGVEALARAARRGGWAAFPVLKAADPDAIRARQGLFAVVEGRVVSVGERARWTYLNFGRDFARDFAVSIPRRSWAAMKRRGLSVEALRGRMVRVRGLVEIRRGPAMEIQAADMIEAEPGSSAPEDTRR